MVHARGKAVVLAPSAARAEVDHYAGLLKVGAFIQGIETKDDVARFKPAGDIFAAALAQVFPLAASECLAVGDTPYDSALRWHANRRAALPGDSRRKALAKRARRLSMPAPGPVRRIRGFTAERLIRFRVLELFDCNLLDPGKYVGRSPMPATRKTKRSTRGRAQARARVAGGK